MKACEGIAALAHITGGGFPDNLPRVLPDGLGVALDLGSFSPQSAFGWLARTGGVAQGEMLRTFNCGIGMAVFAQKEAGEAAMTALQAFGLAPARIGEVTSATGAERVTMTGRLTL